MHAHADAWLKVSANTLLVPKDPAVLLPKPLEHSVWNALIPHPVANFKGAIAVKFIVATNLLRCSNRDSLPQSLYVFTLCQTVSEALRSNVCQLVVLYTVEQNRNSTKGWQPINDKTFLNTFMTTHYPEQPSRKQESVFKDMCVLLFDVLQENKTQYSSLTMHINTHVEPSYSRSVSEATCGRTAARLFAPSSEIMLL